MTRKEFERVSPEAVGVPSGAVEALLNALESGVTEPHGLMLMRHGKVFTEGWWAPYAPGLHHGLQSHTKTYAAAAVGIACGEGLLRLDERVIDIFPELAPAEPSENLKLLTVSDVLCMGCGMDAMPRPGPDWIRDFLACPVTNKPGTTFMYNSVGSTLLGAMVRRRSGLGLHDYLKPRLFDKLGIDAGNLRWMRMPDGMELGGGGLFATTEDNLRLMRLYADGGVCNGERILPEDFVRLSTTLRNESFTEAAVNPVAKDNFYGYGFQLWMCRPTGVYRADGAMGQFTVVDPARDLIIAITENARSARGAQAVLEALWVFLDSVSESGEPLPEEPSAAALSARLSRLALPAERFAPFSPTRALVDGARWRVTSGELRCFGDTFGSFMGGTALPAPVNTFRLDFNADTCVFTADSVTLVFASDGTRRLNLLPDGTKALCSCAWTADGGLELKCRHIEGCQLSDLLLTFSGTGCHIGRYGRPGIFESPISADAVRI